MKHSKLFQAALVSTLAVASVTGVTPAYASFPDVTPNTEGGNAIKKLVDLNIVSGYVDGSFKPGNALTRGEAARILTTLNTKGQSIPNYTSSFEDVPKGHWAETYVSYANEKKLLSGYGNGKFGVNDTLTRAMFARILANMLNVDVPDIELNFTDVAKGAWYEDGIKVLVAYGITKGTSETTFSPNAPVTREQMAIFLDRANLLDQTPPSGQVTITEQLQAYTGEDKELNTVQLQEIIHILRQTDDSGFYSFAYGSYPSIDITTGAISEITPGVFGYEITYRENADYHSYYILIKFDDKGVVGAKLFNEEDFITYTNNTTNGQRALNEFIAAKIKEHGVKGVDFHAEIEENAFNLYTSIENHYYLELHNAKDLFVNVSFYDYEVENYGHYILQFKQLNNEWASDFTFDIATPILEITSPAGFEPVYVEALHQEETYYPIYSFDENNTIHVYGLDAYNTPIAKGTSFTARFYNWDTDAAELHTYTFDGKTFTLTDISVPVEE